MKLVLKIDNTLSCIQNYLMAYSSTQFTSNGHVFLCLKVEAFIIPIYVKLKDIRCFCSIEYVTGARTLINKPTYRSIPLIQMCMNTEFRNSVYFKCIYWH